MIEFANEAVRTEFHLLPIDRQSEWHKIALDFARRGFLLTMFYVEQIDEKTSEVSIRIDKKFDVRDAVDRE